jgi:hypothetical protein
MGSNFAWQSYIHAWGSSERNPYELHQHKNYVRMLGTQPLITCLVVGNTVFLVLDGQWPTAVLAAFDRNEKLARSFDGGQVVLRLVGTVLNQDVITGLSE